MTYETLLNMTKGLLIGDNKLPDDPEVLLSLVQYALITVAQKAESLQLMSLSPTENILRLGEGDYLIRVPETPEDMEDAIDIEDELIPAVARYIASYLSKQKGGIHVQAAERIILDFNAKTYEVLDQMELEALHEGKLDLCVPSIPTTEWLL
jgi:hypothetical protein